MGNFETWLDEMCLNFQMGGHGVVVDGCGERMDNENQAH